MAGNKPGTNQRNKKRARERERERRGREASRRGRKQKRGLFPLYLIPIQRAVEERRRRGGERKRGKRGEEGESNWGYVRRWLRSLRRRIQAVAPAGRSLRRGKLESPPTLLLLPALSFSARIGFCFLFVLCSVYLSRF